MYNQNHLKNFVKFIKQNVHYIKGTDTMLDVILKALNSKSNLPPRRALSEDQSSQNLNIREIMSEQVRGTPQKEEE